MSNTLTPHPDHEMLVRLLDDDLYQLAHMPTAGPHKLVLSVPAGSSLYSFTFG